MTLLLYQRDGATTVPLVAGEPVVVGRDPSADVCLDDRSLSRRHARFLLGEEGSVAVEDLGSTNGTWMSGRRIGQQELAPGTEAALGGVIASVHFHNQLEEGLSSILRHEQLRHLLDVELARARFFSRALTFALVRPLGKDRIPLRKWVPLVQQQLRPVDHMAVYGKDTLEVLLPEMTEAQAQALLTRLVGSVTTLSISCGFASFPASAGSADELIDVARTALRKADRAAPVSSASRSADDGLRAVQMPEGIVGSRSAAMLTAIQSVERAAKSNIPVLLIGETGTGKEVLARHLHQTSPRREAPLISINCGAIPENLVESTLFGHERGAFTGASQQQVGVFAAASGGTVFLDEIGELPAGAQAALLRVLETKKIVRIGSTKETPVDVRVVAATHRDLPAMVREGRFRQDLLFRLNAFEVVIPPLRERREDIGPLSTAFLAEASSNAEIAVDAIEPDALALLEGHRWPGNVRELKNIIERAVVLSEGRTIRVEDLPMDLAAAGAPDAVDEPVAEAGEDEDFRARMDRFESELIAETLRKAEWNQRVAARRLGLPLRTLVYKIRQLNLRRPNAVPVRPPR